MHGSVQMDYSESQSPSHGPGRPMGGPAAPPPGVFSGPSSRNGPACRLRGVSKRDSLGSRWSFPGGLESARGSSTTTDPPARSSEGTWAVALTTTPIQNFNLSMRVKRKARLCWIKFFLELRPPYIVSVWVVILKGNIRLGKHLCFSVPFSKLV